MNYLYLLINLGSIIIPFIYSFHPKIKFYKEWRYIFPGILLTAIVFVSWDMVYTDWGIWGFNPEYLTGVNIFNLPMEEVLFFVAIPYASLFTHFCISKFYPRLRLSPAVTKKLGVLFILLMVICAFVFYGKDYTFLTAIITALILFSTLALRTKLLSSFLVTYLIVLLPFFLVNGILTGSFIQDEVVWYNNAENLTIRMGTIPVEDAFYGFTMLLMAQLIASILKGEKKNDTL